MDIGNAFLDRSRSYLTDDYVPRIERCLEALTDEAVWWRPNEASNSIGNLLLHLAGNLRQWIVSGVGGAPDERRRQEEFDARTPVPASELMGRLKAVVRDVDRVLAGLDPSELLAPRRIQGRDTTVMGAIYHVVEHCSMHTGQIIYITKLIQERDLGLFDVRDGIATPRWHRPSST